MSSIPLLVPSRCVLMIGDDALYIYESGPSQVRLIETLPWERRDFEDAASDIIRREGGGKSLLILNDMTDQHFKGGQRIPRVSPMDRANVVARKLAVAFPNYPIRGALPVKDKLSKSAGLKANASGGLYLFAAVPMSESVSKTLSASKQSMASIAGFTLLPTESSDMVRALSAKLAKREKTKSRWAVMISQHLGGGLRQVITRDGQLAMTRMTPISSMEADPDVWANEVAQEFKATVSYLSRFGYSSDEGTDVFVIATPSAGKRVQNLIDVPCNYTSYTVTEAAGILGFKIGPQHDEYHANPLHAAWAARKSRFILSMEAPDIKEIHGPRQAAMVAGVILLCGASYLAWEVVVQSQAFFSARSDLHSEQQVQSEVEGQYQAELERMKGLGFDVKLIQSSLSAFKSLENDGLRPLPLLEGIGKSLGQELRLDKLVVNRKPIDVQADPQVYVDPLKSAAPKFNFEAVLTLSFPATLAPEQGVQQVNDLNSRLVTNLPATYHIAISKQVADLIYTEDTVGEVGSTGDGNTRPEDFKAEITIKGPLQ